MSHLAVEAFQREICQKFEAEYLASPLELKVGIALNVQDSSFPINGLRLAPEGDTTGWYIWAGQKMSDDGDFFKPLHVAHLDEWCPTVKKFLGLPPGWRFLIANEYEDVWFDQAILNCIS